MIIEREITITVGALAYTETSLPTEYTVAEAVRDALSSKFPNLSMHIDVKSNDATH